MPEMVKTIQVPVPAPQLDWLEAQAAKLDRPVAWIVRDAIRATMNVQKAEAAE